MDGMLIPLPRPVLRVRNYGGTIFLSHAADALELSESAEVMWRGLSPSRSVNGLVDLLATTYGVTAEDVKQDVIEWLSGMVSAGYIELHQACAARTSPRP
jgi:hypothetical protein